MGETVCFEFAAKVGGRAVRRVFPSNVALDVMKICGLRLFTFGGRACCRFAGGRVIGSMRLFTFFAGVHDSET